MIRDDSLDVTGPCAETLFHEFGAAVWAEPGALERFHDSVNDLFRHVTTTSDVRALVLVGALAVEYSTDQVLFAHLPGYKALQANRDVTFSVKIAAIRAARLLPFRILGDADYIRGIRNDFAHDLAIAKLEQLDPKDLASLEPRLNGYQKPIEQTDAARFKDLSMNVSVALLGYAERVRVATSELWVAHGKAL